MQLKQKKPATSIAGFLTDMKTHISYAIETNPQLRRFIARAEACCQRTEPQAFWQMQEAFNDILHKPLWHEVYLAAIEYILRRPTYDGGKDWHVNGLVLFESNEWLLSLRSSNTNGIGLPASKEQASDRVDLISTRTAPAMLAIISSNAENFAFYRLPPGFDPDIYDPHYRITLDRNEQVPAWQRIDIRADIEAVELLPRINTHWSMLEFSLKPVCMQRWEFRKSSGAPVGTTLANARSASLMTMLVELARAKCTTAIDEVWSLLEHPDFNVRWASAKCLGKLNAGTTEKALLKLSNDTHPTIASMAKATLKAHYTPSTTAK